MDAEEDDSRTSSEDELDRLTRSFEEQASKDLRSTARRTQQPRQKTQKSMAEVREEGLQVPVPEQSKGFKMLAMMGYEKGRGLGKAQTGRAEPIEVQLRGNRTGLGVDEEKKRRREEAKEGQAAREQKRQHLGRQMQREFAEQQSSKLADRRFEDQLLSARKVIETLDARKGFARSFLWPPEPQEEEASGGEDEPAADKEAMDPAAVTQSKPSWENQPAKDKLVTALTYLRRHHNYCIHCGCQYDDSTDLERNCPGPMEEDH